MKYRILKLKPFTYIVQVQSTTNENIWYGCAKNTGIPMADKEDMMLFCRAYTLIGAKMMLPKEKQISKEREKLKQRNKILSELFKKAEVVYEREIEE